MRRALARLGGTVSQFSGRLTCRGEVRADIRPALTARRVIIVADVSVLVTELLRTRGQELIAHPDFRVVVAEEQADSAQHELQRRISAMVG